MKPSSGLEPMTLPYHGVTALAVVETLIATWLAEAHIMHGEPASPLLRSAF